MSSSHDVHLLKIDNKEDDIVTHINNWLKHMIETIHEEQEIQRNRQRVTEINHLIDHLREEIDNLELTGGQGYWIDHLGNFVRIICGDIGLACARPKIMCSRRAITEHRHAKI